MGGARCMGMHNGAGAGEWRTVKGAGTMGQSEPLKSPPLVEVVLEVRWQLQPGEGPNLWHDPHYSLVVGKLHASVEASYPEHELLSVAMIPDEISAYTVKHRFRAAKGAWPLIQIGPGILTLNETQRYTTFQSFRPKAIELMETFFKVYPGGQPKITTLILRYIDAVEFDYGTQDVWQFLAGKMHLPVALPDLFFEGIDVAKRPSRFLWEGAFPCNDPKGTATLRFATGRKAEKPVLVWEQIVGTSDDEVPPMPSGFGGWIDCAHALTKAWFLKLIEGELKERFNQ
ncbi:MAG: TIGR04255 family protein [Planctomycetes bacterium]|nr:TIGR04255 family protein [Planctomycetota bacterium]